MVYILWQRHLDTCRLDQLARPHSCPPPFFAAVIFKGGEVSAVEACVADFGQRKTDFAACPLNVAALVDMKTHRVPNKTKAADETEKPPRAAAPAAAVTDGFLLKGEVAARLRKQKRTVERWMARGIIPFIKIGKGRRATVLFRWEDVVNALKANFGHGVICE